MHAVVLVRGRRGLRSAPAALLALALAAVAGLAVPQKAEAARRLPPGVSCVESGPYAVVSQNSVAAIPGDIIVARLRAGSAAPCSTDVGPGDIQIAGPSDNLMLMGAASGYAVLDSGDTDPPRTLSIYDIVRQQVVWSGLHVGEWPVVKATGVTFMLYDGEATRETCPEFDAITARQFTPAIVERSVYDFETRTLTRLGPKKCEGLQ